MASITNSVDSSNRGRSDKERPGAFEEASANRREKERRRETKGEVVKSWRANEREREREVGEEVEDEEKVWREDKDLCGRFVLSPREIFGERN